MNQQLTREARLACRQEVGEMGRNGTSEDCPLLARNLSRKFLFCFIHANDTVHMRLAWPLLVDNKD